MNYFRITEMSDVKISTILLVHVSSAVLCMISARRRDRKRKFGKGDEVTQ